MLRLLLKLRIKIIINSVTRGNLYNKIGWLLAIPFGLLVASLSYFVGSGLFGAICKSLGSAGILSLLNLAFLGFFAFVLLSSIAVAFYACLLPQIFLSGRRPQSP